MQWYYINGCWQRILTINIIKMVEEEQDDGFLSGFISHFSWDKRDVRVDDFPLMASLLLPFGM